MTLIHNMQKPYNKIGNYIYKKVFLYIQASCTQC